MVALERRQQRRQHLRIAECAMSRQARQAEALDQRVEVVSRVLGVHRAREAHGAQHRGREAHAQAAELRAEEAVIEPGVVRDEETPLDATPDLLR